ncbi:hypothetical protein CANCADRAFT_138945 [Tortispora caseinolytica NRRL Y-17796]|uniref:ubiquitinyl hydrolase 1 n=1 Tax=Tortispora caseinolytica NRRL Y-17796 TaxID=767744 RepID=A0A1E4TC85_9ASCO|nr:hypothetical protein CANCADRAFT_138945 [Tortispora caseinolytica NRRL Y-17796]
MASVSIAALSKSTGLSMDDIYREPLVFKPAQDPDPVITELPGVRVLDSETADGDLTKPAKLAQQPPAAADPDEYTGPDRPLYSIDQLKCHWLKIHKPFPGLVNAGVTCYLNSVLQTLLHIPGFANYLLYTHRNECNRSDSCYICILSEIADNVVLAKSTKTPYLPRPLINKLKKLGPGFNIYDQEDAHEFLLSLIDSLQDSLVTKSMPDSLKETSALHCLFGGRIRQQIRCSKCRKASNRFEASLDLSLDLRPSVKTLSEALSDFFEKEELTVKEGNAYKCDSCDEYVDALKSVDLYEPPEYLIIHLKRFGFSAFGTTQKIQRPISFTQHISLADYTIKHPEKANYELIGLISHSGKSANSGHYVCYCKQPSGTWAKYDDDEVQQVSFNAVLKAQAYMLFYAKVHSSSSIAESTPELPSPKASKRAHSASHDKTDAKKRKKATSSGNEQSEKRDSPKNDVDRTPEKPTAVAAVANTPEKRDKPEEAVKPATNGISTPEKPKKLESPLSSGKKVKHRMSIMNGQSPTFAEMLKKKRNRSRDENKSKEEKKSGKLSENYKRIKGPYKPRNTL